MGFGWKTAGALALACAPVWALAGAWPKAPGEGQIILTTTYDRARRGFDADGELGQELRYDKIEVSAFGEFGVLPRLTAVGRTAFQDVTMENEWGREAASGLSASEAGLRATLLQRDWDVLSVQGTAIVPGDVENVTDLRLGEGGWDYEARVMYGRAFEFQGGHGFAEGQFGWRWRAGAPPDEARVDLTLGWSKGPWTVMGQAFALKGTGAQPPRRDYENVKLQASVARDISDDTRLQAGVFRTVSGNSIVQETAVFLGLWKRF